MVAKLRGSGERLWSTLGSGLAHTASHSAVWIDFALDVAGKSATATTRSVRGVRIVAPPPRVTSRRLDSESLPIAPQTRELDPVMDSGPLPSRQRRYPPKGKIERHLLLGARCK